MRRATIGIRLLVVVDEAQLFAPAVAGEVSDEARRRRSAR